MVNIMNIKRLLIPAIVCIFSLTQSAHAEQSITLGVKLMSSTWEGDNGTANSDFKSTEGGQLGFNFSYQVDKFYTGISLQGGEYTFGSNTPDQFTTTGRVPGSNEKIRQGELDLLVGYYFWPRVSLFFDIKGVGSDWVNNAHEQNYSGIGLGVTTYLPLDNKWTVFGSLGFVFDGEIEDGNEIKVGEGNSNALEVGVVYALDENNFINTGLKFRSYDFEYLDSTKQEYTVNTLFFGYNHNFNLI